MVKKPPILALEAVEYLSLEGQRRSYYLYGCILCSILDICGVSVILSCTTAMIPLVSVMEMV